MESQPETRPRNIAVSSPRTNRLRAVNVSRKNRSATSNGSTILAGVDGRSLEARRFRDLVVSFAEPLGGFEGLSEESAALVRQAASITMQNESIQAAAVRGEPVDAEQVVRLTNALTRVLSALKRHRKPKSTAPSLADIVARHRAEEAACKATPPTPAVEDGNEGAP